MKYLKLLSAVLLFALPAKTQKLVYHHTFAPTEGWVNRYEKPYRDDICLNGYWDFQPVDLPAEFVHGKGEAPALPMPQQNAWETTRIKIPSPWNINDFAYSDLEGPDHRNYPSYPSTWNQVKMAWMRKVVEVPSNWQSKQITLHFEAVAGETVVLVNGKEVGRNFDLFLPFELDVTDIVEPGQQAEILVGVRSQWLFEDESTVGRRIIPAGSMWGNVINGIWQDVYLVATPKVLVKDIFAKPLLSKGLLELEVTLENHTSKRAKIELSGQVREWLNHTGTDVDNAPVPNWSLGQETLTCASVAVVDANSQTTQTIQIPVDDGTLRSWTPEQPNLYALLLTMKQGKQLLDIKYLRFGWREWTFDGMQLCLNGRPYSLKSDSWHFMGIPQLTRRYAWAWYQAIKGMNGNAVRLHAQVYPRLYMEMADEMGICVLDETANWASDGGPKLDSELFFAHSRQHLRRLVERDRNYPSVFGWSISNENKPVILYVFKRPDLLPRQKEEWGVWRDIVRTADPTRPWISSDGEDDGDGMLPVTVGHYGDDLAMHHWQQIGKPWGIGETGMCYYGTPEQVAKRNGQRAYESAEGRMEGLANECYHLIKNMRVMGAAYSTVFNMVWYALQPLPLGKRDVTKAPTMTDGVFFGPYVEGLPGVQPERIGPYCTTLNPGYDPHLPLYKPWPLYAALRAANAHPQSAWSAYADVDTLAYMHPQSDMPITPRAVYYVGSVDSSLKQLLDAQGVVYAQKAAKSLVIIDASKPMPAAVVKQISQAADVWLWGITPETVKSYQPLLSTQNGRTLTLAFDSLRRSSFLPENRSWLSGLQNSDFYFCEVQQTDAAEYTMKGSFVDEGEVLLNACKTDWRSWNLRPEELKTAALLRSETECTATLPVFVKHGHIYVSTLVNFADSKKGFDTLSAILRHAGVKANKQTGELEYRNTKRSTDNLLLDPSVDTSKKTSN
ncbi:glycoside hydrolase family 2 protein [Prevotella sp. P6B4]|uniref:glycoside hydrolase family 2 protein n=1 Tax=Prevotella sp. P6B4 TaxID=1410614 RepID=UPI00068893C3|nr:glycoside hydrolase family 2 [Prevotella sp. P6B4]